jgi:hypothetical protein
MTASLLLLLTRILSREVKVKIFTEMRAQKRQKIWPFFVKRDIIIYIIHQHVRVIHRA